MEIDIDDLNFDNSFIQTENLQTENTETKSVVNKKVRNDYSWEELSPNWNLLLLTDNFVIKNCIGDGNCQFRSIETALTNSGYKTTHSKLRNAIAKYIYQLPSSEFWNLIKNYKIEKQNGEFEGGWNPFYIKSKRDFVKEIKKPGFNFQGDEITLSLISKVISIDILIFANHNNSIYINRHLINLDTNNVKGTLNVDHVSGQGTFNPNSKLMILYYDGSHYQTIGLKDKTSGKVQTIFNKPKLPNEINRLLDKTTFLYNHIMHICNEFNCKNLKLNDIIANIEQRIGNQYDKKVFNKLLNKWLKSNYYF